MATLQKRALILFAHGARDPRWAEPFKRLQEIVQSQSPELTVALAFLELMSPRLPELVPELVASGVGDVTVVPVFLGQGGHVMRDLPLIIAELKAAHPAVSFKIAGAVGEDPQVLSAMATYCLGAID
ncbi:sirohydrochlorin chelatase [Herminiimonas fonticola]|uniref:Sirohydrochlorin cobaltochelatase n=1 Tax=Herminiimonas fonticola TaxID=303380 RepID=A0A4R6GI47_9BURK|nr:CbiX/SirB N-terminal domain-containing protein [Herminiimonas fonticola]RBA25480.1 CbiX [Herminiimonas fonticola]TDN94593.1 sirohydrochlorin cobaltochelatase [Herminiimonas fonticola]